MVRSIIVSAFFLIMGVVSCTPVQSDFVRPDTMTFAPLEFKVPEISPVILPNGVRLYLSEDRELPLVRVTALVGAGSINEPVEREGQGALFAALLEEGGAGDRDPSAFEEYLEDLAINFSTDVDSYSSTIDLSLLSEDIDAGIEILLDVLLRPRFDQERLELARRQLIESIRRQNDDPQDIAHRLFNEAVYGDHYFGRTPTIESVSQVKREHLVSFHQKHFVPENTWLAISGDFDRQELEQKIRNRLAVWERSGYERSSIPELTDSAPPAIWLGEKDIPQTTIMIGGVGINKDNPDMMAVRVMNAILGGSGFNSRLMREIRSNRGLAYSVYSYFMIGRRLPGSFIASGETKNQSVGEVVNLMLSEMEIIRTTLVSEEELALAKESRVNSFVFAFTDSHDVLTQQMRLDFYDYPSGYLQNYREQVMTISREDVLRVAKMYLRPEAMAIVLVGNPERADEIAAERQRPLKVVPLTETTGGSP